MVLIGNVGAFTSRTCDLPTATTRTYETQLSAWSLPNPSDFGGFGPLKSTWYDEHNPTARRAVYNDRRLHEDISFSNLGMDWPTFLEEIEPREASTEDSQPPRRNRNPLRRVAGLASRLRRRA
eukprot:scaffold7087_cov168-Amphora_coffeaeformis.AAC.2